MFLTLNLVPAHPTRFQYSMSLRTTVTTFKRLTPLRSLSKKMSANSRSAGSPSAQTSSNAGSTSNSSQYIPQYKRLSRSWPTGSTSSDYSATTSTSQSTTGSQKDMTPMQRWESETLKQSYYTNVAEYETSSNAAGPTTGQGQTGDSNGQQNWSLMGDEESERF